MKPAALILLAGAIAIAPQIVRPRAVAAASPTVETHIPLGMLRNLETTFNTRFEALDTKDPIDMLGYARGLYLPGYGTVFTEEVSLIVTPGISPFRPKYTDADRAQIRQRKLAHIPKVKDLMKDLVKITALTLDSMPDDQKIVFAVRLRYLPEEDTTGLPAQIVASADKKSARLGDIKTEVE